MGEMLRLLQAYQRNARLYASHHLHLTFDPAIGERLHNAFLDTDKLTMIDLPLGTDDSARMFERSKRQHLTTIVFSTMDQLLDNLAMLDNELPHGVGLNEVVLGWKLEGLVFNGKFFALDQRLQDIDFCYIEHHKKFTHSSISTERPLPLSVLATSDDESDPLSQSPVLWSYSLKNRALMTAQRVYCREDLAWFVRNIPKFEVCYYERWCVDYEAEWKVAQEQLRRRRRRRLGHGC